jgi:8-oxo-dGTP pyrophosphatase MutT (NUDIX family)
MPEPPLPPELSGLPPSAGPPATARPAATIILLRRGGRHRDRGVEVLLVRRSPEARFMPGVWVFPGGSVSAGEATEQLAAEADPEELAYRAAAARELREEAGIDLGTDAELIPWSRWITPEPVPIRFDTRFYVALAPAHSPPRPDGVEVTDADWFEPAAALERHAAGDIELVFPTIKHLESLAGYRDSAEVLQAARERVVEPILPRVVGTATEPRVVLPGDPEYEP